VGDVRDHKPPPQEIGGPTVGPISRVYPPTVHLTFTYAPEWYADATAEARADGHRARRREILFAVCAAESAIFEWVRDSVLNRDFQALGEVFPFDERRSVLEKYRDIPKQLAQQGRIPAALHCGGVEFAKFSRLVEYRNGLVHASASRPDRHDLPEGQRPVPTKTELDEVPVGWACDVVRSLLRKLYSDTGTEAPAWIRDAG
jgi:hypothetical protein